jgi:hypothetical protein
MNGGERTAAPGQLSRGSTFDQTTLPTVEPVRSCLDSAESRRPAAGDDIQSIE